jgi:hypothetical protein
MQRVANAGPQDTFGGEQGHLCVVSDRTQLAVGVHQIGNARTTICLKDGGAAHEFDRGAERIANGAAEQAALKTFPNATGRNVSAET